MALVAEKRLYETPQGEIVEELEGAGSLFCAEGTELSGPEADRYSAFMGKKAKKEEQKLKKAEQKEAEAVEDKGGEQAENKGVQHVVSRAAHGSERRGQ